MTKNAIIGTTKEFLAACHREPESLTDRDFAVLESSDPNVAAERRQERARALAKKAEANRIDLASPALTSSAHSLSRQLRKECVLLEGEEFDTWAARNKWLPLPVFIFQTMYEAILDFARTSNEKNEERTNRLERVEQRCVDLESQLTQAAERVKALENRASVRYAGVYQSGAVYEEGNLVTLRGSLWLATQQTAVKPGGDDSGWRLVVKEGRA
jgi:hypothetical protein